eukprot:10233850-Karenia_brevis.AAC.1
MSGSHSEVEEDIMSSFERPCPEPDEEDLKLRRAFKCILKAQLRDQFVRPKGHKELWQQIQ